MVNARFTKKCGTSTDLIRLREIYDTELWTKYIVNDSTSHGDRHIVEYKIRYHSEHWHKIALGFFSTPDILGHWITLHWTKDQNLYLYYSIVIHTLRSRTTLESTP